MSWKKLFVLAVVAAASTSVFAGEIKVHYPWPTAWSYGPEEVCDVDVVLDVGLYVCIVDKSPLKLLQKDLYTYEGCKNIPIESNFDLTVSCSIKSTGVISGEFSCWLSPSVVEAPGETITLCARLTHANVLDQPGGAQNLHVATVTISVMPR